MERPDSGWRNWGDHPLIVLVMLIASLTAIYTFVTNRASPTLESSSTPEDIVLENGFEAVLYGQDGQDLAVSGCANGDLPLGPVGTVDNHIKLSGVENLDQIEKIDVLILDEGLHWRYPCTYPIWQIVKMESGFDGIDLYFEPVHSNSKQATYTIILTYLDGASLRGELTGSAR